MAEERMIDVDRKCPVCHKVFGVLDADRWVYKLRARNGEVLYFHSYGCKRKYEAEHSKPKKQLVYEEEPERKMLKQHRKPVYSQDVIEKVLEAIEEGDNPIEVLQRMGYEHWKKWYNLKKWAEKHNPELRKRMPDSLSEKKLAAG